MVIVPHALLEKLAAPQVLSVFSLLFFSLPGQALAADLSRMDSPLQQLAKASPGEEIPVIVRMHD